MILPDVVAKNLRVAADANDEYAPELVDVGGADAPPPESARLPEPTVRDEATGIGQWQTVAVRDVDDAAEAAKASKKVAKNEKYVARRERRAADEREAAETRAREACAREEAADALSSQLKPGERTEEYRGVKLADDAAAAPKAAPPPAPARDPDAPPPAFKKRKVTAKFRKKSAP